jgi:hypothetical protein
MMWYLQHSYPALGVSVTMGASGKINHAELSFYPIKPFPAGYTEFFLTFPLPAPAPGHPFHYLGRQAF